MENKQDFTHSTRLMAAVDNLENFLNSLQGQAAEGTTARLKELAQLKTENRDLKTKKKDALKRLDGLIVQIESTPHE